MARRNAVKAEVEAEDELAKKRADMERIRHREELNRAAAQFATTVASGEGPFEISLTVKDTKTKRSASIKATVDFGGIVHYREDQQRLQVMIPIQEFQNVTLRNPERARVEE